MIESLKHAGKVIARSIRSPAFASDVARYVLNDMGSFLGVYRHPIKKIIVVSLPKSGSTWIENMLLELPGFNLRYFRVPVSKDKEGRDKPQFFVHEIDASCFHGAPAWGHSIFRFHCRATPNNLKMLAGQEKKWIVGYRDLRDVCVSHYFHLKTVVTSHYDVYQTLSEHEGLTRTFESMRKEFVPWVKEWHDAAKRSEGSICEVRYEDLWTDTRGQLERIMSFFGVQAPEEFYQRALATKISTPQEMKSDLGSRDRLLRSDTARKGGVGGWKDYFSPEQKEEFKTFAGELLIDLGYEKDLNW